VIREEQRTDARPGGDWDTRVKDRPVRVMIVDDHPLARRGLSRLVTRSDEFDVVAEADDIEAALAEYEHVHPDLMVVDITLRSGSGIELIQKLRDRGEEVQIVVLSMHDESLYAEEALRAGARGYVNKQEASEKILEAMHRVMEGGVYLDARFADQIVRRLAQPSKSMGLSPVESLSDREREVFQMHGHGKSVKEIAAELGLSPKTIETYRENIKMKLNLRSSNELVRYAVQWLKDHP
jgi:DNA-binding NarL/FixJ family response regulator